MLTLVSVINTVTLSHRQREAETCCCCYVCSAEPSNLDLTPFKAYIN